MNKPLTRAEWLEWLDTKWKKCLHEAWDKGWADMKDDDDIQVYHSELVAAVLKAVAQERERCAALVEENAMACTNPIFRSLLQSNAQAIRERVKT